MNPVQITLLTIFHPMDGFNVIKSNRENFSMWPTWIMSILILAVKIVSLFTMHYSVAPYEPYEINVPMELITFAGPAISWIIVHYLITTISSGECKIREVYTSLVYAFVPFMILHLPISLASHMFSATTAGTITTLQDIVMAYCLFQVVLSVKTMNDFSIKKTIGIILLTLVGIVLCWCLILLLYGFTGQLLQNIYILFEEFIYIYIN